MNTKNNIVDNYFDLLKALDKDQILLLINKLSSHLINKDETKTSIDDFAGAWASDETAAEIIEMIRENRN